MKKYEHLFGIDPIGAFKKIEDDYKRYFEAAFKIEKASEKNKLSELDKERMRLLDNGNNMSKEPYVELLPEYKQADVTSIDDLVKMFENDFGGEDIARSFFSDFISNGLMPGLMEKFIPYGHQIGMMKKAFSGKDDNGNPLKYKNTVITSGTGSGKTESFLLPLLADIFKEAKSWQPAQDHKNWFLPHNGEYTPCQRHGDERPAAVRAMILYPMNALVEDQMARLREALDSEDVRKFMDTNLGKNRIYFGGYNGSTISQKSYKLYEDGVRIGEVTRKDFQNKRIDVAKRLGKIHENYEDIRKYVNINKQKDDALYISPRLGKDEVTSEMVTRWDMQVTPPDILITNTSMLSIMLMRKAEKNIFEKTKAWLAAEDVEEGDAREVAKKNRVFHIVVDELHLYRGTAGSEVACLLRMLYNALGLKPVVNGEPNPQIRILASSASLGDEYATEKFMQEFFGIYSTTPNQKVFNIQKGDNYSGINKKQSINYEEFKDFPSDVVVESQDYNTRLAKVEEFINRKKWSKKTEDFVKNYHEQIFWDFFNVMPQNSDGSRKPISQNELKKILFNGNEDALRGFLVFRGFVDEMNIKHKLPRFRFHKFFKYIEGLWGELKPNPNGDVDPISSLSYTAEEVGPKKCKMLELLRCENCGQLFIGGNRKIDAGKLTFTLNYPSLEQIPSFNPTPMVQNKSYLDYAIFWPHDINDKPILERGSKFNGENHVVPIDGGEPKYSHGSAIWIPGYLDADTGEFTENKPMIGGGANINNNGIQGFLYRVIDDDKYNRPNSRIVEIDDDKKSRIFAAPCTCPNCHQNYTNRKYTTSPIRSFRTGIDRSNQILSKELLYQLDENSSKLIGFSDSREDAAKQALGIEKEQYRDMVRMMFVQCVDEIGNEVDKIENFVDEEIKKGTNFVQIPLLAKKQFPSIEKATDIATEKLIGGTTASYKTPIISLSDLIGKNIDGRLTTKLLEKGINPAGEAFKYQWYRRSTGDKYYHWSEAYDFNTKMLREANFAETSYVTQIKTQLQNTVFACSFGKYMGVSVLDAGIGYICCTRSDAIEKTPEYRALKNALDSQIDVYEFVDAFVRVLGDNYYYPSNDDDGRDNPHNYEDLKSIVKKPIREFVKNSKTDEKDLGEKLVAFLKKYCTYDDTIVLCLEKLSFSKMTADEYLKCPKCGRVHPNKGFGFCTNTACMTQLDVTVKIKTKDLHNHYISFDILKEPKEPRRLHTEELSGQTDDIQSRLREFKDLILDDNDGYRKTKPIDMICVTTTMEVGVDIGSLQAIFQGNMPPTRYNYQQRVGRGGRRGQAFSTAFTFCRGRSHDVYYYNKATDEMVGGIPATPTLSLSPYNDTDANGISIKRMKMAIMKRVVVKELLHMAFLGLDYNYNLVDTAGEFETLEKWTGTTKKILEDYINQNPNVINEIVHSYFDQFNENNCIDSDLNDLIDWIKNKMITQMDNAINKTSDLTKGLAQYLTETGFLPIYGMPSDSRNFYHGFDQGNKKVKSIDRSSELAISEFAPGAEKTKDKGKYRVEAITLPIKEESDNRGHLGFFDPQGDALSDRYVMTYQNEISSSCLNNEIQDIEDVVKGEVSLEGDSQNITAKGVNDTLKNNQRLIVIPQAYRSLDIKDNYGMPVENNDKGSSFVQCQLFAKDNGNGNSTKVVKNVGITLYELGLSDDPTVWHVNSNNGHFYTGDYSRTIGEPYGGYTNFSFYRGDGNGVEKITANQNTIDIALGSKKVTEMIKLELKDYPKTLNLSLKNGNKSAIRAAFYSAAYLLQRALADKLDIQPDEIEIIEKIDEQHDFPVIYLSDALANGASIVSYLYENNNLQTLIERIIDFKPFDDSTPQEKCFMQSLIDHRNECLTACQKCLLAYNNRGFHHVLDWRMGVGILRLMMDSTYDFGFDKNKRTNYEELKDYDRLIIPACAQKLRFSNFYNYFDNANKRKKGIYHPLWNLDEFRNTDPQTKGDDIEWYNTFKLLRSDLTKDNNTPIVAPSIRRKKGIVNSGSTTSSQNQNAGNSLGQVTSSNNTPIKEGVDDDFEL